MFVSLGFVALLQTMYYAKNCACKEGKITKTTAEIKKKVMENFPFKKNEKNK